MSLRAVRESDFPAWREVRVRNEQWLLPWEPLRRPDLADPTRDQSAFNARCVARERDALADHAYPFGIFIGERFVGEVNINNITRGALQGATVGYWIDQQAAGQSYVAEAVAVVAQFAFEQLDLHRLEVAIIPRNANSRRVVEKLGLRCEGTAQRFLEIAGVWENHLRFAITAEEWADRRNSLVATWITE